LMWLAGDHELAFYGLVVAAGSDGLDGIIARHMDQKSVLGSYLDPLADKVLIMSLSLTCAGVDLLPWWAVALIVLRDSFLMTGAYVIARREASSRGLALFASTIRSDKPLEIRATTLSKVNTALQLTLITCAIAGAAFPSSQVAYMVPTLAYTTSATTVVSLADYIRRPGYN
jgi:cardiolipin synthase